MENTFVLFISAFIVSIQGARILVVAPTPSLSHQIIFHPLNKALADRGHEVTFITTNPAYPKGGGPENLTEINLGPLSYEMWKKEFTLSEFGKDNFVYMGIRAIIEATPKIFETQMQTEAIKEVIEGKEFDLVMLEAWFRPALIWTEIYKVPMIKVSSLGMTFDNPEAIGAPVHPLLYPNGFHQRIYDLTIIEQFQELYKRYFVDSLFKKNEMEEDALLKRIFRDVSPLRDLNQNTNMMFLNVMHPMWDRNRPVPKSVVYFGNVHQKPFQELPKDLKLFLDSSRNGVIYMSFGTNVPPSKLPARIINIFVKVFSELPYDVLWKWDTDNLPGQSSNIKISKWFPQSDIFRHPKLKLVITQGGLQTVEEAISNAKPMLGVPFLADQWLNVENIAHLGFGKGLDIDDLTENLFKETVLDLIQNESYRDNVVRYRSLVNDKPMTSLELAVWWIEHLLRYGGTHLRSPASSLSVIDYHEIPLLSWLLVCSSTIVLLLSLTAYYIVNRLLKRFVIKFTVKET